MFIHVRKWIGAGLLIAGSSIGIGMLAMPIATGAAGFFPSAAILVLAGLFMASTAMLLIEVDLGDAVYANILSLAEHNLGKGVKLLVWIAYLFLFYCLMIAYTSKGGSVLNLLFGSFGVSLDSLLAPSVLLILLVVIPIFFGRKAVDFVNRFLMVGLLLSYGYIVCIGFEAFDSKNLTQIDLFQVIPVIPFVITAYGFHNMIPTISDYLSKNRGDLIKAVLFGCGLTFVVYLLWTLVIQASTPYEGENGIGKAFTEGLIGTELLHRVSQSVAVKISAIYLSLFAIVTSMLGQGIGLVDFLFDGLRVNRTKPNRLAIMGLIFIPSLLCALLFPDIFFLGLGLAGGIAAMFLFGLLPAMMAYVFRKRHRAPRLLPGGTPILVLIGLLSLIVMTYEILHQLGFKP